jgi:acetyltransferase-like isoleucine patch superfamily enzyme
MKQSTFRRIVGSRLLPRRTRLPPEVTIGRHTYGHDRSTFPIITEGARIEIGAFCSIAPGVRILGGGEHVTSRVSTFPLNARLADPAKRNAPDALETGPTLIGNDVWLGLGAIILGGVTVGDGAVVGAGAVVTEAIPPYAVVVGNPARVVRYRFASEICERLLALRWWEWSDREILALLPLFMRSAESFLAEVEHKRGTAGA